MQRRPIFGLFELPNTPRSTGPHPRDSGDLPTWAIHEGRLGTVFYTPARSDDVLFPRECRLPPRALRYAERQSSFGGPGRWYPCLHPCARGAMRSVDACVGAFGRGGRLRRGRARRVAGQVIGAFAPRGLPFRGTSQSYYGVFAESRQPSLSPLIPLSLCRRLVRQPRLRHVYI